MKNWYKIPLSNWGLLFGEMRRDMLCSGIFVVMCGSFYIGISYDSHIQVSEEQGQMQIKDDC